MTNPPSEPVRDIPLRFLSTRVRHATELRAHYAPPQRFSPTILHIIPWLSVLLLLGFAGFFWMETARFPGHTADLDLPDVPFAEGARSSISIAVKPDRSTGAPCVVLDGLLHRLGNDGQRESFRRILAEKIQTNHETTVLVFEDRDLSHGTTMEIVDLIRSAGAQKACFVTEE